MAKGMTNIEATQAVSKANTLASLDAFINRYGEIEGKNKYYASCVINKYNLSLERYIKDFGEAAGTEIWRKRFDNGNGSSKVATKIFKEVICRLGDTFSDKAYFKSENNREFGKRGPNNKYYFYDFVIPSLKLCIELNGSFYHGDPQKYKSGDFIKFGGKEILVDNLWEKDKIKKKLIEDCDYTMIELWYRKANDFEMLVQQCVEIVTSFMKGKDSVE
jgi:very-short-patch-repair endonuclease